MPLTGCDVPNILGTHFPYMRFQETNQSLNRTPKDRLVHTLFDLGLIRIEPNKPAR